jgi:DNA-directed RNA polymerase specialized sigma24 family protein
MVPGMAEEGDERWRRVLQELLIGDRTALATLNRQVTAHLLHWRAYDFRDAWDDLRHEVLTAIVQNARAGRLRDPAVFLGYIHIITRNQFIDRLKAQLQWPSHQPLPWEQAVDQPPTGPGRAPGGPRHRAMETPT